MTSTAVNFEYEWMNDGSLRLRFMDAEDAILGQQIVGVEALAALQILIGLAAAKSGEVKAETLMAMFNSVGIDADLDTATALKEADRVRAGITPEGNIGVNVVEES